MRRFPVRWIVIGLAAVCLAGLGYWGVKTLSAEHEQGQLVIATKPVTRGDIEVTVRGWGQLQATEERDVTSGAKGVIKEVLFQLGQTVKKGQVLATIDPGSLSVELKTAELNLETKLIAAARSFGVSPDQVPTVDPSIALTVRAPIAGRVTGLTASTGSDLGSGKVCSVVDDSRLIIKLQLPKPLYDLIRPGTEVTFRADRFEGGTKGVVTKCDPNPIKGDVAYFYEVWAEIPNPGLLRVGDQGILVFHAPGGEFQQVAKITSFGTEEPVMAAVSGRVKAVYAREGMMVNKGDPIIEFEPGQALLNAMSLQLEVKSLMIKVEDYRSQLESLTIVSPIDGVVTASEVAVGQAVDKGYRVARVSNFQDMNLMLMVDEIDVPKVQIGQRATVDVWGPQGQQSVPATVSQLGAIGQAREGLAGFNITLSVTNPGFLRPGMGGSANIFVSRKQNVLLCPVEALYKENNKWFVDLKEGKDRKPVEVQVGIMNDRFAEIVQGLTEGQEVVVGMTKQQTPTQPKTSAPAVKIPIR